MSDGSQDANYKDLDLAIVLGTVVLEKAAKLAHDAVVGATIVVDLTKINDKPELREGTLFMAGLNIFLTFSGPIQPTVMYQPDSLTTEEASFVKMADI
jgi:2-keto-4-pentenoate hydratase/2-oxohepta-3-ene-1,7-dioic acid hydratase in catechol pathway